MKLRNFIPGLSRKQSFGATALGAAAIGVVLYLVLRKGTPKLQSMYDWDDTINVLQGGQVQVRVPRGTYVVVSPDVLLLSQVNVGNETHVVIMPVPLSDRMYTIDTLLADQLTSKTYPIHIEAWPAKTFQPSAQPLPAPR